jgi:hypothetical protein
LGKVDNRNMRRVLLFSYLFLFNKSRIGNFINHEDEKYPCYILIKENNVHMYYRSVLWSSKLPEINKLYYKYKSNIETILLHPEIFGVTNNRVYNDAFRTFNFSMQQSVAFTSNYHITQTNQRQKGVNNNIICSVCLY